MGLFSFLTGKKAAAPAPAARTEPGADVIRVASPPPKPAAKPSSKPSAPADAPAAPAQAVQASSTGASQVKLRMKLAAATRNGDLEEAWRAAKGLETIQANAGRRVAARVWREQAERIYDQM